MSDMAQHILTLTVKAGEALKANRCVEADGTYPAAGGNTLGVTRTEAEDTENVSVTTLGVIGVQASAAVAKGALVQTGADGRVQTQAGNGTPIGRALEAAAAADEVIRVHLIPN